MTKLFNASLTDQTHKEVEKFAHSTKYTIVVWFILFACFFDIPYFEYGEEYESKSKMFNGGFIFTMFI